MLELKSQRVWDSLKGIDIEDPKIQEELKKAFEEGLERFKKNPDSFDEVSNLVSRIEAKLSLYPKVLDPRTFREIPFPSNVQGRVPKNLRVSWGGMERSSFIKEWYIRGYSTPKGGWDKYDIHHILPREFGGTNEFWNLVPVERTSNHKLFNEFWREFIEL